MLVILMSILNVLTHLITLLFYFVRTELRPFKPLQPHGSRASPAWNPFHSVMASGSVSGPTLAKLLVAVNLVKTQNDSGELLDSSTTDPLLTLLKQKCLRTKALATSQSPDEEFISSVP